MIPGDLLRRVGKERREIVASPSPVTTIQQGVVVVGTEATPVALGLRKRKTLVLYPPDSGAVYWGNANVSSSNGAPLEAGGSVVTIPIDPDIGLDVYAVAEQATAIRVVELR